jgi:hypothetical protein
MSALSIIVILIVLVISVGGIYYFMYVNTSTAYSGNNGTVSGNTYCTGNWGSADGSNKNMKCDYAIDNSNGTKLDCTTVYALSSPPIQNITDYCY